LKGFATFDKCGVRVDNFNKINFIYGVNGSGKTTISNFLKNPNAPRFSECELEWVNDAPLKTLVYNKSFRDENFGNGPIEGVFTLGKGPKEDALTIEKKQIELKELKDSLAIKNKTHDSQVLMRTELENDFKEEIWNEIFKKYKTDFKEAFDGAMKKESFKNRLVESFQKFIQPGLSFEQINKKAKTIFGNRPGKLDPLPSIEFSETSRIEISRIWSKKIIGKSDVCISSLIQKLGINDWVNEGRSYLSSLPVCPFCQKNTITEDFRKQLDAFFDESFTGDLSKAREYSLLYNTETQRILDELNSLEAKEKQNKSTKLKIEEYTKIAKVVSTQIAGNRELLEKKIKEPSRSIELPSLKEGLAQLQQLISEANIEIENHNSIVDNYETEKSRLIDAIWHFLVDENKTRLETFIKKIAGLDKGIDALKKQRNELESKCQAIGNEIRVISKSLTSVQPSVEEINKTLKAYGFHNFEIVPSKTDKNQYRIQREDGSLAENTLSEGEVTFITFLYFLQLAKGSTSSDQINEERVLIIDDPISSLDSNILFVVSSLIKELIKCIKKGNDNIRQLILFTHNVFFHKEVSFIDGRTKDCNKTFFWILRKNSGRSSIEEFKMKNPIQNSYELLWQELRNKDNSSGVTVQNIMRRIIENYFKILGKFGDDDLINKFKDKEEKEICRSLLCWINDGSHCIPDDLYIEQQEDISNKYFDVFKSIFFHTKHIEHYNMMMNED